MYYQKKPICLLLTLHFSIHLIFQLAFQHQRCPTEAKLLCGEQHNSRYPICISSVRVQVLPRISAIKSGLGIRLTRQKAREGNNKNIL